MSLLDDPLFAELRAEATQWHLTQSATVRRYGTMLVNGRDQPTEVLIFYGLVGVNRREGQGGYFAIEFPHTAKLRPGDVVTLAQRPDLPLVVDDYTPATEAAPLGKARCTLRKEAPHAS